jgi:hypothetical protein
VAETEIDRRVAIWLTAARIAGARVGIVILMEGPIEEEEDLHHSSHIRLIRR